MVQRQERNCGFLDKAQLLKLRKKAIRSGVWFRALRRIDRALVDLTLKVAGSVRSTILAEGISAVASKLQELCESNLSRGMRGIGFQTARKLSVIAQRWGNTDARAWMSDVGFVRFLTVMNLCGHPLAVAG